MINKLKIGLLVVALSLAVGVSSANAATTDVNFSARTEVFIGSYGYGIESGTAESATVDPVAGTLTVVKPTALVFTSANRFRLDNDASVATVCSPTQSSITLTSAGTVIVTPSTSVNNICPSPGTALYVAPSGGGGSPYVPPITVTVVPATPATPGTVIPGCGNRTTGFSSSSGASCVGNTSTTPATPATPASGIRTSFDFGTTTLKNGSRGAAVMELQRFLNQVLNLGLVVDGKLGPKTIAVIKTWQKNNGLVVDGLIGVKTKAKMNASVQ